MYSVYNAHEYLVRNMYAYIIKLKCVFMVNLAVRSSAWWHFNTIINKVATKIMSPSKSRVSLSQLFASAAHHIN